MLNDGTTYTAYVMTIIADSSYVNNNPDKLSRNTYNQRDADFSGQVLYFTPQGRYVSGWQYKNGRIVTPQAKQQETAAQNIGSKKTASYNGENEYCTDWYWVTYLNGEAIDYEYLYTSCSTGGGYGGGSGPECPTSPNINSGGRQAVNNMPPPPPPDDGGGFPPPTGSGCTVTTPTKIENKVEDPCLRAMVDKTINADVTSKINTLIQNVFGNSAKLNLTFTDATTLPAGVEGRTFSNGGIDANGNLNVDVILNRNSLPSTSQQYITTVIMHEAVHAYLFANGTASNLQHETIAVDYVTKMAGALQQIFPTLSDSDAKNLSLGGLESTTTFKNTIASDLGLSGSFDAIQAAYSVGGLGTRCK
jgi:hypothetical protein